MHRIFGTQPPGTDGIGAVSELLERPDDFLYEWANNASGAAPDLNRLSAVVAMYNLPAGESANRLFIAEEISNMGLLAVRWKYDSLHAKLAAQGGAGSPVYQLLMNACQALRFTSSNLIGGFLAEDARAPRWRQPSLALFCSKAVHGRMVSDVKPRLMELHHTELKHVVDAACNRGMTLNGLAEIAEFQSDTIRISADVPGLGAFAVMSRMPSWRELTRVKSQTNFGLEEVQQTA